MSKTKGVTKKEVRLRWVFPDNLQSYYVTNLVVQHQPSAFIISFFEAWPPVIIGPTNEEKKKALQEVDSVEAKCVARLVVSPENMSSFVKVMADNLDSYEKSISKKKDTEEAK